MGQLEYFITPKKSWTWEALNLINTKMNKVPRKIKGFKDILGLN